MNKEDLEAKKVKVTAKYKKKIVKLDKQIKELKPIDGWYVMSDDSGYKYYMRYYKGGDFIFGITEDSDWNDLIVHNEGGLSNHRLATPKEVTERLTKFINDRGYKEGVKVAGSDHKCILRGDVEYFKNEFGEHFILFGGFAIWGSGLGWAKIVEEPKYKVVDIETVTVAGSGSIVHVVKIAMSRGPVGSVVDQKDITERIETGLNKK